MVINDILQWLSREDILSSPLCCLDIRRCNARNRRMQPILEALQQAAERMGRTPLSTTVNHISAVSEKPL